jgi:hypothetical protein
MAEQAFAAIYAHITTALTSAVDAGGPFQTIADTGTTLGVKLVEISMGVFLAGIIVVLTKVLAPVVTGLKEVKGKQRNPHPASHQQGQRIPSPI